MEVLFTPSARDQLLELVAAMVREDRDRAADLLDELERRLEAVAESGGDGDAVAPGDAVVAEGGLRLCYWVRAGALWVLAVLPVQAR